MLGHFSHPWYPVLAGSLSPSCRSEPWQRDGRGSWKADPGQSAPGALLPSSSGCSTAAPAPGLPHAPGGPGRAACAAAPAAAARPHAAHGWAAAWRSRSPLTSHSGVRSCWQPAASVGRSQFAIIASAPATCAGSRTSRAYSATPSSSSAEPVLATSRRTRARSPAPQAKSCGTSAIGRQQLGQRRKQWPGWPVQRQQRAVQADDGRRSGMALGRCRADARG